MTSKAATYLAFHNIVKRRLTTLTLTASTPRPFPSSATPPHHHHNTLVSKATKGRKLPKNHFTSHPPRSNPSSAPQPQHTPQESVSKSGTATTSTPPSKHPKRKPSRHTPLASPSSLRRLAVEAQRSRATLIKGRGKTRHVDPEVETKDVTAYCGAELYNVHVARDLLRREGWDVEPQVSGGEAVVALWPQVLHVRTPVGGVGWRWGRSREGFVEEDREGEGVVGDVFVFPSGSVVTWNVEERVGRALVERVLVGAAENSHLDRLEAEDLEYLEDPTREDSEILGDTIILGTKPLDSHTQAHAEHHHQHSTSPSAQHHHPPQDTPRHESDTLLAKIAFSSALARSTKLAVLENTLATYFHTTHSLPHLLSRGTAPRFTRAFILRKTGELLSIRAQLNLYSELTDSLPDLFWDSPHELGLESYYDAAGRALDVGQRIRTLNEKMDYASEIASVLRERLSERHGHLLEWIIIWLILIEVAYGSLHLWRERRERIDPESDRNLMREYLLRELEKGDEEVKRVKKD